jgi:hypothetical protein
MQLMNLLCLPLVAAVASAAPMPPVNPTFSALPPVASSKEGRTCIKPEGKSRNPICYDRTQPWHLDPPPKLDFHLPPLPKIGFHHPPPPKIGHHPPLPKIDHHPPPPKFDFHHPPAPALKKVSPPLSGNTTRRDPHGGPALVGRFSPDAVAERGVEGLVGKMD